MNSINPHLSRSAHLRVFFYLQKSGYAKAHPVRMVPKIEFLYLVPLIPVNFYRCK